jgi:hypothetical protein
MTKLTKEEIKRGRELAQALLDRDGPNEFYQRCAAWARKGTLTRPQFDRLQLMEANRPVKRKRFPTYRSKAPITLAQIS